MNTAPSLASDHRLPLLDGVRGIAAIAVMLYHAGGMFPGLGAFSRAYLFVDFFFLLSGFVLGLSIDPKLRAGLAPFAFLRLRWLRLWPMILVGVAVGAVPFALVNDLATTLPLLLLAALLLPSFAVPAVPWPLNLPHWSLAMEVLANLAHALVLHRLPTRALVLLAGAMGLALAVAIARAGGSDVGEGAFAWDIALLRIGFAYPLGLALARGHVAREQRGGWIGPLLLPLVVLGALTLLPLGRAAGDLLVTLLVLPLGLYWATLARLPQGLEGAMGWLGSISYPLYAIHLPLLALVAMWRHDGPGLLAALALVLASAALLARRFERRQPVGDVIAAPRTA